MPSPSLTGSLPYCRHSFRQCFVAFAVTKYCVTCLAIICSRNCCLSVVRLPGPGGSHILIQDSMMVSKACRDAIGFDSAAYRNRRTGTLIPLSRCQVCARVRVCMYVCIYIYMQPLPQNPQNPYLLLMYSTGGSSNAYNVCALVYAMVITKYGYYMKALIWQLP